MLLVGSKAMQYWGYDVKVNDIDIMGPKIPGFDCADYSLLNNEEFYNKYKSDRNVVIGGHKLNVCTTNGLRVLKRSHLWRDLAFDKHCLHYHKILGKIDKQDDYKFMLERQKLTIAAYGRGSPNLRQGNAEFFDDAVEKKYDHDWLHELVACGQPMYKRLKRDQSLAWCEKDLWLSLPYIDRLRCASEEAYVIAVERFIVPGATPHRLAFIKALRKLCTTLTSGWFRDFSIDNYPELLYGYDSEVIPRVMRELNYEH